MKKALGVFLGLIACAITFVAIHSMTDPGATNTTAEVAEVAKGLKSAAARIRPTLPKKVDDATTLTDVSSRGMVLTYYYTVDNDNFELLPNYMKVAQGVTIGLACNTEDMKGAMKAGAVYEYNYSDGKSNPLGGFVVKAADCN
jgi:hypothetical protein